MKIEVWSDFACPFCYIGIERLFRVLGDLPFREQVYVCFKSFELDPNAPDVPEKTLYEMLAKKFQISIAEAKQMNERIGAMGQEIGLQLNFDRIQYTNTSEAHRLMKYAEKFDKDYLLARKLFKAYFTDGKNICQYETLLDLSEQLDLNRSEVEQFLETCKFQKRVREDQELARELGIQSVPFFVFNEKYALSGAQEEEVFKEALHKVWEEEQKLSENKFQKKAAKETYCCGDDQCELDKE